MEGGREREGLVVEKEFEEKVGGRSGRDGGGEDESLFLPLPPIMGFV